MASSSYFILLLSVLGLLKEFRPSEPFLSPFLNGTKNFTEYEINNEIYPVGTYSNMSLLIIIFLLTDWLCYKPIIILQAVSGIVTWSLLVWAHGIPAMQVAQISYGLYAACDVAYSAYLYAAVEKSEYRKATAQTKAALLVGKTGSGLVGQLLVMYHLMDYLQLNYLTLAALIIIALGAWLLPPVNHSSYFNRRSLERGKTDGKTELQLQTNRAENSRSEVVVTPEERGSLLDITDGESPTRESGTYNLSMVYQLWKNSMKNPHTVKWTVWSALSFCMYLQVSYYIQLLWQAMINTGKEDKIYHGFSNSFNSLAGAACAYAVGFLRVDWSEYGEVILAVSSVAQGGLLLLMANLRAGLVYHYVAYAAFKVLYQASSTIVSAEIATSLESDSFGLVFGVIQFLALTGQSSLTLLVTKVFTLDIRPQFLLYGSLCIILGIGFAASGMFTLCHLKKEKRQTHLEINTDIT